jgi:hypothetical protein
MRQNKQAAAIFRASMQNQQQTECDNSHMSKNSENKSSRSADLNSGLLPSGCSSTPTSTGAFYGLKQTTDS